MPDRPNVLWIMADQHNAKCTEWGSYPTTAQTPHLRRLADQGVRFDRAICQNPICTPSRVSYWTGQYPSNHGVYATPRGDLEDNGFGGFSVETMPTLFSVAQEQGYRTGLFSRHSSRHSTVGPKLSPPSTLRSSHRDTVFVFIKIFNTQPQHHRS